ncbi:hypothetical protein DL767_004162 [Monosporascus sp. MG133]|nr:hypothetical protein DL767_004162 [Monosporascus sp. MG133]
MVGGLLDNVSDWLNNLTWLKWWVRDGNGDLRPLQDDLDAKDDKTEQAKWNGYGGRGFTNRKTQTRRHPRENEQYKPEKTYHAALQPDYTSSQESLENLDEVSSGTETSRGSSGSEEENGYREYQRDPRSPQWPRESESFRSKHIRFVGLQNSRTRNRHSSNPLPPLSFRPLPAPSYPQAPGYPPPLGHPQLPGRPPPRTHFQQTQYSSAVEGPGYASPPTGDESGELPVGKNSALSARESSRYDAHRKNDWPSKESCSRNYSKDSVKPPHNPRLFAMFFRTTTESSLDSYEFPLLPILQFRTWRPWLFTKTAAAAAAPPRQNRPQTAPRPTLRSIVLDAPWLGEQRSPRQESIAVSQARKFMPDECNEWTYYVPKEREENEWTSSTC